MVKRGHTQAENNLQYNNALSLCILMDAQYRQDREEFVKGLVQK